jgi:hypothetical protein
MKRSAIKCRRLKPRPLDDANAYEAYKNRFGWHCEIGYYVGPVITPSGKLFMMWPNLIHGENRLQRHHVWSLNRRPDLRSAIIVLEESMHNYCHAHPPEGRVLSVLAKLRKRDRLNEMAEFTLDEINTAAGKRVCGVIEGYAFSDPRFIEWQHESVERLRGLEAVT